MDNVTAHKRAGCAMLIEARVAQLLYLPPYSPESKINSCVWPKRKTLAHSQAHNGPSPGGAHAPPNVFAWFRHHGPWSNRSLTMVAHKPSFIVKQVSLLSLSGLLN
jgi:transposase